MERWQEQGEWSEQAGRQQQGRERLSYICILLAYLVGMQRVSIGFREMRHLQKQGQVIAALSFLKLNYHDEPGGIYSVKK